MPPPTMTNVCSAAIGGDPGRERRPRVGGPEWME